jgi:hypothetical protein
LDTAVEYAERQPGVSVISMSYAYAEGGNSEQLEDNVYTTPVGHRGIVFVAATGDIGNGNPPFPAVATYPAASPNVLAVGGTILTLTPTTNGQPPVSSESAWTGSDGGASAFEAEPSYQMGVVPANMATFTNPLTLAPAPNMRAIPDVAYAAQNFAIYDSFSSSFSTKQGGPWTVVGGTSAGAPQWAALIAIVDQQLAVSGAPSLDGPSQLLPALYQIGTPNGAFQDITLGQSTTDGMPWNGIPLNTTGSNVYQNAVAGYDLATGLGTPFAPGLVQNLVNKFFVSPAKQTITWTGNAGNLNWDTAGNWSSNTVPGPLDDVVINGNGLTIVHGSFGYTIANGMLMPTTFVGTSYDKISSLNVTGTNVTLDLFAGTLDLSGNGNADGTFQVDQPGDVVNLSLGTLANATISKGTSITVNGQGIVDGGIFFGTLNVSAGAILDLAGSWTNMSTGTIKAQPNATVYLGDTWDVGVNPLLPLTYDYWGNIGTITLRAFGNNEIILG